MQVDIPLPEQLFTIEEGFEFGVNEEFSLVMRLAFSNTPVYEEKFPIKGGYDKDRFRAADAARDKFRVNVAAKLATIFQGA